MATTFKSNSTLAALKEIGIATVPQLTEKTGVNERMTKRYLRWAKRDGLAEQVPDLTPKSFRTTAAYDAADDSTPLARRPRRTSSPDTADAGSETAPTTRRSRRQVATADVEPIVRGNVAQIAAGLVDPAIDALYNELVGYCGVCGNPDRWPTGETCPVCAERATPNGPRLPDVHLEPMAEPTTSYANDGERAGEITRVLRRIATEHGTPNRFPVAEVVSLLPASFGAMTVGRVLRNKFHQISQDLAEAGLEVAVLTIEGAKVFDIASV